MMRISVKLIFISLLFFSYSLSAQDDDFSFEMLDVEVKGESDGKYDTAKEMLSQGQLTEALELLDEIMNNPKLKKHKQEAEYEIAQTLYKMGFLHSSLDIFSQILDQGARHKYYRKSRDWLFFLAPKMKDRHLVVARIARYSKKLGIPEQFKDKFNYQLAQYFFDKYLLAERERAFEEEKEKQEPSSEDSFSFDEKDVSSTEDQNDPMSFESDKSSVEDAFESGGEEEFDFDDEEFDFADEELSGGDDGFDFSDNSSNKKIKKKRRKKKRRKKKKRKKKNPVAVEADVVDSNSEKNSSSEDGEMVAEVKKNEKGKGRSKGKKASSSSFLKKARKYINKVSPKYEKHAKALYLKGIIAYALNQFEPAVDSLRQVVRLTHPEKGEVNDPKLREMSFFTLARIHYQFEQFRYAIFYYERISRDSENWLDSVFESSWAYFRLGEYERALGNLVTIQAPFFIDEYYPESHILKAITFYENCRYPESRAFLSEFKERYSGLIHELDRLLNGDMTSKELFNTLQDIQEKVRNGNDDDVNSFAMTARLLRLAFSDRRLGYFRKAVDEVVAEKKKLEEQSANFLAGKLHARLLKTMDEREDKLIGMSGELLREKLFTERRLLKQLEAKLVRIHFEIAKEEKQGLEAQLEGKEYVLSIDPYKLTTATDDERTYWPFVGEYWRDELGTYRYTLMKGCRPPADDRVE